MPVKYKGILNNMPYYMARATFGGITQCDWSICGALFAVIC